MCFESENFSDAAALEDIVAVTSEGSFVQTTITSSDMAEIFAAINVYYTPFLMLFGSFGNILAIAVLCMSNLKFQSASVYLSSICVSDTVFLCQLYPPWVDVVRDTNNFYRPAVCYIVSYASYVSSSTSTWIVVAFTIERYIAVTYPLQRYQRCTVRRARYIVFVIACAALLLNIPVLIFVSPYEDCSIAAKYLEYAQYFNVVDTTLVFWIPLAVITVLNVAIISRVWEMDRERRELLRSEPDLCRLGRGPLPNFRTQNRITRMLLVVSSSFIFFNLPAYTMRILAYIYMPEDSGWTTWTALQQCATILFNTTFGINMMMYIASGQNFRRNLRQTLLCQGRRHRCITVAARPAVRQVRSISTSCASAGAEVVHGGSVAAAPPVLHQPRHGGGLPAAPPVLHQPRHCGGLPAAPPVLNQPRHCGGLAVAPPVLNQPRHCGGLPAAPPVLNQPRHCGGLAAAPPVPNYPRVHCSIAARRFNQCRGQPQHEEIEMTTHTFRQSPGSPHHSLNRRVQTPPRPMTYLFFPYRNLLNSRFGNSSPPSSDLYN